MSNIKTRARALSILTKVEDEQAYVSDLLTQASKEEGLNFPLLQRLVKGTLSWRSNISETLKKVAGKADAHLSMRAVRALEIAAYQFLFLERVPREVVVEETLAIVKRGAATSQREQQLVRKILVDLQKVSRPKQRLTEGLSDSALARQFSHPEWVIKRWRAEIGERQTVALCKANNTPWPVCIRTNTLKIASQKLKKELIADGLQIEAAKFVADSFYIRKFPRGQRLDTLDAIRAGFFQVQDESASLVSLLLAPKPGDLVIDLCSAPGGKTTHCATLMRNRGKIIALDASKNRLDLVTENCRRLGITIVTTRAADAATFKHSRLADCVLLDAPCSGLGVLGRKSDIRWAKDEATVLELVTLQSRLIEHAATLVRPGGRLVYSTCTTLREENETIVETFLAAHPEFSQSPPPAEMASELFSKEGYVRTWPHRHAMGGSFAAALIKKM